MGIERTVMLAEDDCMEMTRHIEAVKEMSDVEGSD